jgi:hypothetical protein
MIPFMGYAVALVAFVIGGVIGYLRHYEPVPPTRVVYCTSLEQARENRCSPHPPARPAPVSASAAGWLPAPPSESAAPPSAQ